MITTPPTTPPAGLCKSIDQSGLRRVFAFFCCWVPLSPPRDPPRDPLSDPAGNRRKSRNRASPTRRGLESLGALGRYNETSGRFPSLRSEKNGLPGDSSLHPRPPRCRLPPNRPEKPRQPPPPRRPPAPSPAKRQNFKRERVSQTLPKEKTVGQLGQLDSYSWSVGSPNCTKPTNTNQLYHPTVQLYPTVQLCPSGVPPYAAVRLMGQ